MRLNINSLSGILKNIAIKCDKQGNKNNFIDDAEEAQTYLKAKASISDNTFIFNNKKYSADGSILSSPEEDTNLDEINENDRFITEQLSQDSKFALQEYNNTHGHATSVGSGKGFSNAYDKKIIKYANKYKLDPNLVKAIIRQESSFNAKAQTPKSAKADCRGLMQINAKYYKGDLYNVDKNLDLGCKILRHSLDTFKGNVTYALMGYNAGEAGAKRMIRKGITSTRYTRSVNNHYNEIKPKKNLSVQA